MSRENEKGFKDIHPVLIELREYLRETEISIKQCAEDLYNYYIDSDKSQENYYQRLNRLLKGYTEDPTDQELKAVKRWIHINKNPHLYGQILHSIPNLPKKITQLDRYLDSSYVNRIEAKKIIRALKRLTPLSTESLES